MTNLYDAPQSLNMAAQKHASVNHLYDGKPYAIHLISTINWSAKYYNCMIFKYGEKNKINDMIVSMEACACHDLLEDCRMTYNDLINELNPFFPRDYIGTVDKIADIVYLVTNEKGKTRAERANDKYYDGIKSNRLAILVKLCDRLANIEYSKNTKSSMFDKYKKEHKHFKEKLYTPEFNFLWDEMEKLLEIQYEIKISMPKNRDTKSPHVTFVVDYEKFMRGIPTINPKYNSISKPDMKNIVEEKHHLRKHLTAHEYYEICNNVAASVSSLLTDETKVVNKPREGNIKWDCGRLNNCCPFVPNDLPDMLYHSANGCPNLCEYFQPIKKEYWSKPEHVPLNSWIRRKDDPSTLSYIISVSEIGISFNNYGSISVKPWNYLKNYEHSIDGKNWKPCLVK